MTLSQFCAHSGRKDNNRKFRQCASCKKLPHCSKFCQIKNWTTHKNYCAPTSCKSVQAKTSIQKTKVKMVPLIRNKYLVDCYLQSKKKKAKKSRALWDSGSQVTIIDEKWRKENLPNVMLRDIKELLEGDNNLDFTAANGESMPYISWVEITFKLAPAAEVIVSTLVMKVLLGPSSVPM